MCKFKENFIKRKRRKLKKYNNTEKKNNPLIWAIEELILIIIVSTVSIILYDIYINIDVEPKTNYEVLKTAKEVDVENLSDISEILERTSKSVVRNIKNCNKRYRNI